MDKKENGQFSVDKLTRKRLSPIVFSAILGAVLVLTLTWAVAQSPSQAQVQPPDFTLSYKTGPQYAKPGDTVTYTIVVENNGGAIQNVLLSDTLPAGITLVPDSCAYFDGIWWPCGPLDDLWNGRKNFAPGDRITTTFAATVSASANTLHYPLVNRAYIDWDSGQHEMAHTTFIMHAIPVFSLFYEPAPNNAEKGQIITYTIVAVNSGDSVTQAVLSDTLPTGVDFVPGSCTYDVGPNPPPGSVNLPCNDLTPGERSPVWQADMPHGARITTTFRVTVTIPQGSALWPLQNCAYLGWDIVREQACETVLANHIRRIYLPLVMRNWVWWYAYDVYEPNDTPAQAYGPLTSDEVYEAYIWNAADVDDYYYIEPSTSNTVTVDLWHIPEGADYDLYVYYYDGESYRQVAYSNETGNQPEQVRFTPEPNRRYFIRVYSDIDLGGGYDNETPYRLRARYE